MPEDAMLQEALDAISQGQRARGRDLLTRLLRADQTNPIYWLWMSSVVDTCNEKIYCLQMVLRHDPENQTAKRGLVLLGGLPPPEDLYPVPPARRKWVVKEGEPLPTGFKAILSNPTLRAIAFSGTGLLVVGLILLGVFGLRSRPGSLFVGLSLTVTPQPWTPSPTATLLPTNTPRDRTPTPTFIGPTPLWMFLEATYTPTPLYINTPHPISEAYRAGLRAFDTGDLTEMLRFMQQAAQVEPQAADAHYYVGEAYRLIGDLENALAAYDQALTVDANFAPAYLGRARVRLLSDPTAEVQEDLDLAISKDPNLAEAYLVRSAYSILRGDYEAALEDLERGDDLLPDSPLVYLTRAQAYLASGKDAAALEAAQKAYDLDQTLLPVYLLLGNANLSTGNPGQAFKFLQIYMRYEKDDPKAWASLGQAIYELGRDYPAAIDAFERAIQLDENHFTAFLYRGYTYLELGEGQLAVNDLFNARNLNRESFSASLGLGRALLLAERTDDAILQMNGSEKLAQEDLQLAELYYWRAQAKEAIGERAAAANDWQALSVLQVEDIPDKWLRMARARLAQLRPTASATLSPLTKTPLPPTSTTGETSTKTPTPTPTRTPTQPRPTKTPTP